MKNNLVHVVGAGLAGSEAAWQLARAGVPVVLHEMRPLRPTEAHQTENCAELVCSNTFKTFITSHLHNPITYVNCQVVAMHNRDHTHKDDAKVGLLREDVPLALAYKEQF